MPPESAGRVQLPVSPGSVAPVGVRVLAYALDVLVLLAAVAVGLAVDDPLLAGLLGVLTALAQWIGEGYSGATVGSAVTGIRTVSAATGRPPGLWAAFVRQLVVAASALVLVVGQWVVVASGAWDRSPAQRGWHDKAAGTLVLRARAVPRGGAGATLAWNTTPARAVDRPAAPLVPDPPVTAGPLVRPRHADRPAPAPVITEVPGVGDAPEPVTMAMPTVAPPVRRAPARHVPTAAAAASAQHALWLLFDTGEVLDVTGDGLVGRSPTAEAGVVHVVPIDDPDRSISKVHLAFGLEPGGLRLWVLDRGSTNGTVLVGPDGRSATLRPGVRAVVEPGWTVRFGRRSLAVHAR